MAVAPMMAAVIVVMTTMIARVIQVMAKVLNTLREAIVVMAFMINMIFITMLYAPKRLPVAYVIC